MTAQDGAAGLKFQVLTLVTGRQSFHQHVGSTCRSAVRNGRPGYDARQKRHISGQQRTTSTCTRTDAEPGVAVSEGTLSPGVGWGRAHKAPLLQ